MNFYNPFEDSTDRFKSLMDADQNLPSGNSVEPFDSNALLEKGTSKGLQSAASVIQEARKRAEMDKATKAQVSEMFGKLFKDLNDRYGLNISMDFDSFSNSLQYIIEPTNKKALELYLSEAYGRFRVVLYGQYLNAIALLSSQILDPAYILSDSMTYAEKLMIMKQLYEFMQTMNNIYKEVNVSDTDMKLEKLASDQKSGTNMRLDDPAVRDFMEALTKSIKQ